MILCHGNCPHWKPDTHFDFQSGLFSISGVTAAALDTENHVQAQSLGSPKLPLENRNCNTLTTNHSPFHPSLLRRSHYRIHQCYIEVKLESQVELVRSIHFSQQEKKKKEWILMCCGFSRVKGFSASVTFLVWGKLYYTLVTRKFPTDPGRINTTVIDPGMHVVWTSLAWALGEQKFIYI